MGGSSMRFRGEPLTRAGPPLFWPRRSTLAAAGAGALQAIRVVFVYAQATLVTATRERVGLLGKGVLIGTRAPGNRPPKAQRP
jgi:hypothetical protein